MAMYSATIHPQINVAQHPARREPAYAQTENRSGVVGNGFIEARVDFGKNGESICILLNRVSGERFELGCAPPEFLLDSGPVYAQDAQFSRIEARGSVDVASLSVVFAYQAFDLELCYVARRGQPSLQKCVTVRNVRESARIERLVTSHHQIPSECHALLHDGGTYFPILFLRARKGGLFYCGDFPGYWAQLEGNAFSMHYHPGETLRPGRSFPAISMRIGVTELTGRSYQNAFHDTGACLDWGERQWFCEFLLLCSKPQQLPCIELKGPDELPYAPSDLEVIAQCEWWGAGHVFLPQMLADMEAYPLADIVRLRMQEQGVSPLLVLRRGRADNLHWVALDEKGDAVTAHRTACFACEGFRDSLVDRFLAMAERYGFIDVEVRGTPIVSCHNAGHPHPPGRAAVSHAFLGLAEVAEALRENCSTVRCAGTYGSYGSGMARLFDAISTVVQEHPLPLPDIHLGRLYADQQRLYFRRSHDFLIPKSKLTNSVGFVPDGARDAPYPGAEVYPWYLYHDSQGWRYAVISAIATGLRHRFHTVPQDLAMEDRLFAEKWLAWEAEHLDTLRRVEELFDEPGVGKVDGYAYAGDSSAVVFMFNTGYEPQSVNLKLHLSRDTEYLMRELYPREYNYLGPDDGLFRRDSSFRLELAPKEARVVEVVRRSPASAKRKRPEVFGAVSVEENGGLQVMGRPGEQREVGIRYNGAFRRHTVKWPGKPFAPSITNWTIKEKPLNDGLTTLPEGDFVGDKWERGQPPRRNIWLCARANVPQEAAEGIDTSPFVLNRPVWTWDDRLFCVVRFEPAAADDPIRTSHETYGVPDAYKRALPMKCGIDLAPLNVGLRAWVNGEETPVYPALAAWRGITPNPWPVTAYFFEAGSHLHFGRRNRIVLFARHFYPEAFRGVYLEHAMPRDTSKMLDLT